MITSLKHPSGGRRWNIPRFLFLEGFPKGSSGRFFWKVSPWSVKWSVKYIYIYIRYIRYTIYNYEGLLFSRSWACRGWILEPSFSDRFAAARMRLLLLLLSLSFFTTPFIFRSTRQHLFKIILSAQRHFWSICKQFMNTIVRLFVCTICFYLAPAAEYAIRFMYIFEEIWTIHKQS